MNRKIEFKLANSSDARRIGLMSRDLIEHGLPWSWDSARITQQIRCHDTVVLTAWDKREIVGFAIMRFLEESAHLNLLAVDAPYQGRGVGRRLVEWLEQSARVAGTFIISLEVRLSNQGARTFYRKLGYTELARIPRYYASREAAMRMSRDLRVRYPLRSD
ncbi:MAG: GNAT family N-acetyltransferase [Acidiferrobacterales bacterium]|nr:GNAT family N-acetyltransferase [Acidiferrobacterales bacterium]